MKSMKAAVVAAGTPLALIGMATGAMAAGTYPFTANFKYRLDSANWSQGAGTTNYSFTCTSGHGQQYVVTLYKNSVWGDDSKGSKTLMCDGTEDKASWGSLNSGTYHITLSKGDNGVYVVGSGKVTYP